jgi:hypothetical protein
MPNALDLERLTIRQAAQARDDFAQFMDPLDFLKKQLARLFTRRDQAFTPLSHNDWQCALIGRARHLLVQDVLAALPLRLERKHSVKVK